MVCLLRFVLCLCLCTLPLWAQEAHPSATDLKPTPQQANTAALIAEIIANVHYKKASLNDQLSEKILARYLRELDPRKDIFLKEDIVRLEKYRHGLDDAMREKRLEAVFEIFDIYRTRLNERVAYVDDVLRIGLDFKTDDHYPFKRDDNSWIANPKTLDEHWRTRLKQEAIALRLSSERPADALTTLRNRYSKLNEGSARLRANDVFRTFINAYLSTIEPHSAYYLPRKPRNTESKLKAALVGIGVQLKAQHEHAIIKRVFAGGSADRSRQLHEGDRIIAVAEGRYGDFVDVVAWPLTDVVERIRGPQGSVVRLRILPKGADFRTAYVVVTVTRDKIALQERVARRILLEIPGVKHRYGVIQIPRFYIDYAGFGRGAEHFRSTSQHVEGLLRELLEDGVEGIVIDLRGNRGGALLAAVRLAGLFIRSGPVVQIKDASGAIEVNRDSDSRVVYSGPLAVLVDRYSASASEIFAAAIQDYRRGIVIGERSYGKGTVQQTFDLNSYSAASQATFGQLVTTVAQYFRITGESTQVRGVVPDIEMLTAYYPGEYGERLEKNALPWERVPALIFQAIAHPLHITQETRGRHEQRLQSEAVFLIFSQILAVRRSDQLRKDATLSERKHRTQKGEGQRRELENELRSAFGLLPLAMHEPSDGRLETLWNHAILEEAVKILSDASH